MKFLKVYGLMKLCVNNFIFQNNIYKDIICHTLPNHVCISLLNFSQSVTNLFTENGSTI